MPRRSNFGEARVTQKREQCNAKKLAFLRAMPSESNFAELAPTILKSFFFRKKTSVCRFLSCLFLYLQPMLALARVVRRTLWVNY